MNIQTPLDEWDAWESEWKHAGGSASARASVSANLSKARRSLVLARVAETVIATAALAVTALALYHAASTFEVVLGLVCGGAIAALWTRRVIVRQSEHAADAAGSSRYLEYLRGVRVQQLRLAHFMWAVLALELAFFVPWWIRGSRVHPRTITSVSSWVSMYLPIVAIASLFAWSYRLRRTARADLRSIDEIASDYQDGDV